MPYLCDEVTEIIRDTAIEVGARDPKNGQLYHANSKVGTLVANFLRRCDEQNIPRGGRERIPVLPFSPP